MKVPARRKQSEVDKTRDSETHGMGGLTAEAMASGKAKMSRA
jgi:hypothetical protein